MRSKYSLLQATPCNLKPWKRTLSCKISIPGTGWRHWCDHILLPHDRSEGGQVPLGTPVRAGGCKLTPNNFLLLPFVCYSCSVPLAPALHQPCLYPLRIAFFLEPLETGSSLAVNILVMPWGTWAELELSCMRWHQQVTDGTGEPARVPFLEAHLWVHTQDMNTSPFLGYSPLSSWR